jgi:hypothetical protein
MFVLYTILIFSLPGLKNSSETTFRNLLIFGSEKHEKIFKEQTILLARENLAVQERDIRITIVNAGSNLFSKYKVNPDEFTVILIGKDGSEKLRTNELLQPAKLFAVIDAMPMRKREMRRQ